MSLKNSFSPRKYQQRQLLTESLDYYFSSPFYPMPPARYIDGTVYKNDGRCQFIHRCKLPENTHYCIVDVKVESTVVGGVRCVSTCANQVPVKMLPPPNKVNCAMQASTRTGHVSL